MSCSNDCATIESYTIPLLESSYGNIPSCSWSLLESSYGNIPSCSWSLLESSYGNIPSCSWSNYSSNNNLGIWGGTAICHQIFMPSGRCTFRFFWPGRSTIVIGQRVGRHQMSTSFIKPSQRDKCQKTNCVKPTNDHTAVTHRRRSRMLKSMQNRFTIGLNT